MSKFLKLSQINQDIEILEDAGKIKAATVLHNKFLREAQAAPSSNAKVIDLTNPTSDNRPSERKDFSDGSYVLKKRNPDYSEDWVWVDKDGRQRVQKNVPPEKVLVNYQTSPGNWTTGLVNKGEDPKLADPKHREFARNQKWLDKVPGYRDFLRFKPMPYEEREFREIDGLNSDAGKILYNELAVKAGQKPIQFPGYETQLAPSATPQAPTSKTQPTTTTSTQVQPAAPATPATPATTPTTTTPQTNTNQPATQGSTIPKLQERIDHYNKKIETYKNTTDPNKKSQMLMYLSQYIENNYRDGLLDSQSYKNLMTALGEKGLS